MGEWLGLVGGFSTWVKVGWVLWLIWCLVQIEWYRQRAAKHATRPQVRERSSRDSSSDGWPSTSRAQSVTSHAGGSPEFLRALGVIDE